MASSSGASGARAEGLRTSKRGFLDGVERWWVRAKSSPPRLGRGTGREGGMIRIGVAGMGTRLLGTNRCCALDSGALYYYIERC